MLYAPFQDAFWFRLSAAAGFTAVPPFPGRNIFFKKIYVAASIFILQGTIRGGIRTHDTRSMNPLPYQLSYKKLLWMPLCKTPFCLVRDFHPRGLPCRQMLLNGANPVQACCKRLSSIFEQGVALRLWVRTYLTRNFIYLLFTPLQSTIHQTLSLRLFVGCCLCFYDPIIPIISMIILEKKLRAYFQARNTDCLCSRSLTLSIKLSGDTTFSIGPKESTRMSSSVSSSRS